VKEDDKDNALIVDVLDGGSLESFLKKIDFSKLSGLIPAVAQDYYTKDILMLAFMNEEALRKTLETGYAHYFSRSRNKLWKKGETSGHTQAVKEIFFDCDNDSILLKIIQNGPACHTGHKSCFYSKVNNGLSVSVDASDDNKNDVIFYSLKLLYDHIAGRKNSDPEKSYTAKLMKEGHEKIGKKLQEESLELILSVASNSEKDKIIYEAADLLFFYMVMLVYSGIDFYSVINELKKREGVSGLDEKNNRKQK
jgi:phosphoribosyl-ATP pyrophosphohydrolase/phosphoribosyl-AMP cyclohydrolase